MIAFLAVCAWIGALSSVLRLVIAPTGTGWLPQRCRGRGHGPTAQGDNGRRGALASTLVLLGHRLGATTSLR
jgi:hypothetical protein